MHVGHGYSILQVFQWTRHNIVKSFFIGLVPILLYEALDLKWLALPWTVVALLGTATAFIIGFRNSQTYNRTWEARQIWGSITNLSRAWGTMCKNLFLDMTWLVVPFSMLISWVFTSLDALRILLKEVLTMYQSHKLAATLKLI